jgi:hypothetical protein
VGVAWESVRGAGGEDVVARLLAPDGKTRGKALSLQSDAAGVQACVRLATDGAGRWLATWVGDGPEGFGAYARVLLDEGAPQ